MAGHGKAFHCGIQGGRKIRHQLYQDRSDHILVPSDTQIRQLRLDRQYHEVHKQPFGELFSGSPKRRRLHV